MNDQPRGVIAPVTTPFSRQGDLLFDALTRNIEKYLQTPLAGILVGGSTGEAPHLEFGEAVQIVEVVAPLIPSSKTFFVGIACSTLREAKRFIDKVSHLKLDGFLVSVPSYYKNRMNELALANFLESVADHSPHPVLLYNIPAFSGILMGVELVEELSDHPNIRGMKDSSGDLIYMQKVLDKTAKNDFEVITGSAETLSFAMVLGVHRGILGVACVLPELVDGVLRAFEQHQPDLSARQIELCRVSWTLVKDLGIQGVKHAMDLCGYEGGFCRLPLTRLTDIEKQRVECVLESVRMSRL